MQLCEACEKLFTTIECTRAKIQRLLSFFSLLGWGGVRPSPLGTVATIWPIVPAPEAVGE
jgi:hypothetical protein